jgi:hypothetical protein
LGISDDLEADDVADDVPGLEEAGDEEMEEENVLEEID